MAEFGLHRSERLTSRKSIEILFRTGKAISSPPFRLLYREVESMDVPVQMAVAVPKKMIRRAVDRNLLKRRTREAYRLNKSIIHNSTSQKSFGIQLVFHYQSKDISDFRTIKNALRFLLMKLSAKLD